MHAFCRASAVDWLDPGFDCALSILVKPDRETDTAPNAKAAVPGG